MSFGHPDWAPWVIDEEKVREISLLIHRYVCLILEINQALPLLKAAYDRGLNTWDTANVYSNGHSEMIIGKAIKQYNIPRQKLVILTKCFGVVGEEPGIRGVAFPDIGKTKDYVNQGGELPF